MSDVTRILLQIESGDPSAAESLLPLIYEELRKLATARVVQEKPGQTLQATALVHEAYLRLVGKGDAKCWESRGHFFAAAARAMRQILVDNARHKNRIKHGGNWSRVQLEDVPLIAPHLREDLLSLDAALDKLKQVDGTAAEVIQLRYFAGLTVAQAAGYLDISPRSAERAWTYARAWLRREMQKSKASE